MKSLATLQDEIHVRSNFDGSFTILQLYKGSIVKKRGSTNSQAFDRIRDESLNETQSRYGYTLKQAYQAFYREIRNAK